VPWAHLDLDAVTTATTPAHRASDMARVIIRTEVDITLCMTTTRILVTRIISAGIQTKTVIIVKVAVMKIGMVTNPMIGIGVDSLSVLYPFG